MRKRILSILLVVVTLLIALPANFMTEAAESNTVFYGDANCDGEIDLQDELFLRRYNADLYTPEFNIKNADVNGDNKIDLKDVLMIRKYIAGWDIVLGPA